MSELSPLTQSQLYRFFLQGQTPMAILLGPQHRFEIVNESYAAFVGRDVVGKTVAEAFANDPQVVEYYIPILDKMYQTGEAYDLKESPVEFVNAESGVDKRWIDVKYSALKDAAGATVGLMLLIIDVTEQAQVKRQHQQSQDNFEMLSNSISHVIWITDASGRIIHYNQKWYEYTGFTLNASSDEGVWLQAVHPEDYPDLRQKWMNSIQEETILEAEFRFRNSNGQYRWHMMRTTPSRKKNGTINSWYGTATDIHDIKMAEQRLEESESQFRTLSNSIPHLAWMAHANGNVFWYNEKWYEYTGTTAEAMETSGWQSVYESQRLPEVLKNWEASIRLGIPFELEFPIKNANGKFEWFLTRVTALKDSCGQVLRWFGTHTHIHEQKKITENQKFLAEASKLLSSSLNYRETLQFLAKLAVPKLADWCSIDVVEDGVPESIAVLHPDPKMMRLADALRNQYPTDWNSSGGAPEVLRSGVAVMYSILTDEMLKANSVDDEHFKILKDLKMKSAILVPIKARDKTLGILTLVSSESGRIYDHHDLAIAEEVGRRAGLAIDNSKMFGEAQTAVKVRDEFLSVASHELKTPLSSLKMQIQMGEKLIEKGKIESLTPEKLAKMFKICGRQADRLTVLVDDLLNVVQIQSGKLQYVFRHMNLSELTREICERYMDIAQASGSAIQVSIEDSVEGSWDQNRIEQLIVNLLSNAIKYGAGKPISVSVKQQESMAMIEVSDQGIGIPAEKTHAIFERFERAIASSNISGLGLGLYITRAIVEEHGGTIQVASRLGQGSRFTVSLPFSPTP